MNEHNERRTRHLIAAVITGTIAVACGASNSESGPTNSGVGSGAGAPFGKEIDGIATFYDADGTGNCGYDRSADLMVAAIDMPQYDGSNACGTCVTVKGPKGTVTVQIVDSCPPCDNNHLDLSAEAFAKIADPVDGRVPIKWQTVACGIQGPVAFHFKEGSSQYWTAIQIRNHKLPVKKLEYKRDGSYVDMPRENYNYFVAENGVGEQPGGLELRLTAVDGQTLEQKLDGVADNATVEGSAQFE